MKLFMQQVLKMLQIRRHKGAPSEAEACKRSHHRAAPAQTQLSEGKHVCDSTGVFPLERLTFLQLKHIDGLLTAL